MTHDTETKLKVIIEQYVASLDGRYHKHCSDTMLIALLMEKFRKPGIRSDDSRGNQFADGDLNVAYEVGTTIFEALLEHGCRAGGNGHHVAQNFQAFLRENWNSHAAEATQ